MGVTIIYPDDYCIGVIVLIIFLLMIAGPIYFFSEFSNFSVANPVLNTDISVGFVVNKTLSLKDLTERMVPRQSSPPI